MVLIQGTQLRTNQELQHAKSKIKFRLFLNLRIWLLTFYLLPIGVISTFRFFEHFIFGVEETIIFNKTTTNSLPTILTGHYILVSLFFISYWCYNFSLASQLIKTAPVSFIDAHGEVFAVDEKKHLASSRRSGALVRDNSDVISCSIQENVLQVITASTSTRRTSGSPAVARIFFTENAFIKPADVETMLTNKSN